VVQSSILHIRHECRCNERNRFLTFCSSNVQYRDCSWYKQASHYSAVTRILAPTPRISNWGHHPEFWSNLLKSLLPQSPPHQHTAGPVHVEWGTVRKRALRVPCKPKLPPSKAVPPVSVPKPCGSCCTRFKALVR